MRLRRPPDTYRSFDWGVRPLFTRGVTLVAPAPPARPEAHPSARRRARPGGTRDRRTLSAAVVGSVAIHAIVFAGWPGGRVAENVLRSTRSMEAVQPVEVVRLARNTEPPAPTAPETARPKIMKAVTETPRVEVSEVSVSRPTFADLSPEPSLHFAAGPPRGLEGSGSGEGAGPGEGAADGSATAGDDALRTPAVPRSILRTWSPPRKLFGTEILVRVHTDAAGRPTGPVELHPPTTDRETNEEIIYRVRNLEYRPATVGGVAVDAWAEITFQFCYEGTSAASPPSKAYGTGDPCTRGRAAAAAEAPSRTP